MKFCGMDPGIHGAMSLIITDTNLGIVNYDAFNFDRMTEPEIAARLKLLMPDPESIMKAPLPVVLVERQGTRPTDARPNIGKLHHQWGMLRGILYAYHVRFDDITPAVWQRTFGLLMPKGTSPTFKKNQHKAAAQRLFPEVKITHSNADALLIAEHGRRLYLKGADDG